jgi:hypothetical protein
MSTQNPPKGKKDCNEWQWSFYECKGIATNERNKGGRKAFKHEVLIQEVLLFHDKVP